MCVKAHAAYCGVFSDLETCPNKDCGELRYNPDVLKAGVRTPRLQFTTIPIGPILQVLYHSSDSAKKLQYFLQQLKELAALPYVDTYDDMCCGSEFINLFRAGGIQLGDIILQLSLDGAQLFCDKESDEKEPHSGGGLTALMECVALLGDGQQKCRPH